MSPDQSDSKARLAARIKALSKSRPGGLAPVERRPWVERRDPRQDTFRDARIVLQDGAELRCVLKDFSRSGGRIVLQGAGALPAYFTLAIGSTGMSFRAAVVWADNDEAGLRWIAQDS